MGDVFSARWTAIPGGGKPRFTPDQQYIVLTSRIDNKIYIVKAIFETSSVGTGIELEASVSYPNPTQDILNLDFTIIEPNQTEITLTNMEGIQVKQVENSYLSEGPHHYEINTTDLPQGAYFLNLNSGNYYYNQQIMISR